MSNNYTPKYLGMKPERANLVIALIRNYDQFVDEAESLLATGVGIYTDGQPHGMNTSDPTAITAGQREQILANIKAIDKGIESVPEEYRAVVWKWVKEAIPLYKIDGSEYASERTWYEYKKRFILEVARQKNWLVE